MRVIDLAEDLRVSPGDLLALLRAMGIPVQSQDAPVHDEDVARVLARVERGRRAGKKDATDAIQSAIEESRAPSRRRRRRKAADVVFEEPEAVEEEDEVERAEVEATSEVDDAVAVEPVAEAPEVPPQADAEVVPPVEKETVEAVQDVEEGASTAAAEAGVDAESPALEELDGDMAVGSKLKRRLRMPDMGPPGAAGLDRPWRRKSLGADGPPSICASPDTCRECRPGRAGPDPGGGLYLRRPEAGKEEGEKAAARRPGRGAGQHPACHGRAQGGREETA